MTAAATADWIGATPARSLSSVLIWARRWDLRIRRDGGGAGGVDGRDGVVAGADPGRASLAAVEVASP